jgi:crossover junction endodeoxyribonuclease RusA
VNTYWRHPTRGALAGRHLISERGRAYRELVASRHKSVNQTNDQFTGRLGIVIAASPPDKRRRDLDNILKALLDSLTYAEVIEDDSQFDVICIVRQSPVKDGKVEIVICESENL